MNCFFHRNGVELPYVVNDESYDFDFQQPHVIQPPRNVQMGDELMVECTYTTKGKNRPLFVRYFCFNKMLPFLFFD